jgi:probable rRNA maturation factor
MAIKLYTEGIHLPYRGLSSARLRAWAKKIALSLSVEKAALNIICMDNASIKTINRRYRKKNRPTDVISFAYREKPLPGMELYGEALGDVCISLERAAEQADSYSATFDEEMKRLLVHGILHLVGYDHERSAREAGRMKKKEDELLALL